MYIKRTVTAGATKEIIKTYSSKYGKNKKRAARGKPTPEKIRKINERMAEDKSRWKINENFKPNDLHIVLTYRKDKRPPPAAASKIAAAVLRKARAAYKKHGQEFKYILVTGYGKNDKQTLEEMRTQKHDEVALHHHLIVNYIDLRVWTEIWKEYGRVLISPLDERGDYTQLANYLLYHTKDHFREKDAPYRKRWSCSRNLKEPKIEDTVVRADSWRETPKPEKGYYIDRDSVRYGVSDVTGYPYQFYRMIRIAPPNRPADKRGA